MKYVIHLQLHSSVTDWRIYPHKQYLAVCKKNWYREHVNQQVIQGTVIVS